MWHQNGGRGTKGWLGTVRWQMPLNIWEIWAVSKLSADNWIYYWGGGGLVLKTFCIWNFFLFNFKLIAVLVFCLFEIFSLKNCKIELQISGTVLIISWKHRKRKLNLHSFDFLRLDNYCVWFENEFGGVLFLAWSGVGCSRQHQFGKVRLFRVARA